MNTLNNHYYHNYLNTKTIHLETNSNFERDSTIAKIGKFIIYGLSSIFQSNSNLSNRFVILISLSSMLLPTDSMADDYTEVVRRSEADPNNNFQNLQLSNFPNGNIMIGWTNKTTAGNKHIFLAVDKSIPPLTDDTVHEILDEVADKTSIFKISKISTGTAIAVWNDKISSVYSTINGRLIRSSGGKIRQIFRIDENDLGDNTSPAVAGSKDGKWFVVWNNNKKTSIEGKAFNCDSNATSIINISQNLTGKNLSPKITSLIDDSFVVSWLNEIDNSFKIYWTYIDQAWQLHGKTFTIDTENFDSEPVLHIQHHENGGFMLFFTSNSKKIIQIHTYNHNYRYGAPIKNFNITTDNEIHFIDTTSLLNEKTIITWIQSHFETKKTWWSEIAKDGKSASVVKGNGATSNDLRSAGVTEIFDGGILFTSITDQSILFIINCLTSKQEQCKINNSITRTPINDTTCSTTLAPTPSPTPTPPTTMIATTLSPTLSPTTSPTPNPTPPTTMITMTPSPTLSPTPSPTSSPPTTMITMTPSPTSSPPTTMIATTPYPTTTPTTTTTTPKITTTTALKTTPMPSTTKMPMTKFLPVEPAATSLPSISGDGLSPTEIAGIVGGVVCLLSIGSCGAFLIYRCIIKPVVMLNGIGTIQELKIINGSEFFTARDSSRIIISPDDTSQKKPTPEDVF